MTGIYDVIVLGTGSMGAAACFYLSKKGLNVLGIDQYDVPHKNGSHTGQSRIIRKSYFEHSDYVPLLERAYDNWNEFETSIDDQLYFETGLLYMGSPKDVLLGGVRTASEKYNIPLTTLSYHDLTNNYPQINIPKDTFGLFEPKAGFLLPEKAIASFVSKARENQAQIHSNEKVVKWKKEGANFEVTTNKGKYKTKKLVITAGAWLGQILDELNLSLKVTLQILAWAELKNMSPFKAEEFPCWMMTDESKNGMYYGFPYTPEIVAGSSGLKFALHAPGKTFGLNDVRNLSLQEQKELAAFIQAFTGQSLTSSLRIESCLYSYSPDEHFIIDRHPNYKDVVIAGGFSGHGFKFSSVIGEVLSDMVTDDPLNVPIDFLSLDRFK